MLLTSQEEIRGYWTKSLVASNNPLVILAEMLEAGLIPEDQKTELFYMEVVSTN